MNAIALTPALAYAAGRDAGNASMRKAGRTRWDQNDAVKAAEATNNLLAFLHPEFLDAMVCAGSITDAHAAKVRGWIKAQE